MQNNMKNIKSKLLVFLSLWLFTSCGVQWQYTALNYAAAYDGIYRTRTNIKVPEVKVDTNNSKWDYTNYRFNQPINIYHRNYTLWEPSPYSLLWNSNQYWTNWAFNYPYTTWPGWNRPWMGNVHYDWYGYNYLRWGNYWRNDNTYVYINGRRGSNLIYNRTNRTNLERPTRTRVIRNVTPIRTRSTQPAIRNNNRRPPYNTRPSNNTRLRINNTNTTRSRSTNVNRSTTSRSGNSARRQ